MKKLVYTVVKEKEMLEKIPHRMFCDGLAVSYRYYENGRFTNVITNEALFNLGLTEPQLYEIAKVNMKKFMPVITEVEEDVFTITSLNNDLLGPSLALMPGMMERVLNKTGADKLYLVVGLNKVAITAKASKIFSLGRVTERIGRLMTYEREEGLVLI